MTGFVSTFISRAVATARSAGIVAGLAGVLASAQLPESPTVVHGQVEVTTTGPNMTVKQDTKFGIVNWGSFSVGAGQGVLFANGNGATLNRVTGLKPSQIDGTLTATGSLYLLNPNGVIIGTDGRVLTGGNFVASTRDLADADFLDGGGFTLAGDSTAGVTNLGKISSLGGDVLLAGYTVENHGAIVAPSGRIGLAAGQRVDVLADVSWMNGAYAVSLGERGNDVTNTGLLQSLIAELRTHNGNIYALAGNNTGLIQATGVKNEGGKVFLTADSGTVQSSGTIVATRDGSGGDIELSGAYIENFGGAQDVSGANGGTIKLNADSITTDTAMLARGTAGAGGTISAEASKELLVTAAGVIDASGTTGGGSVALDATAGTLIFSGAAAADSSAGRGGNVVLGGEHVGMFGGVIEANGATGGGAIALGGGFHGDPIWSTDFASPLVDWANSHTTFVSDQASLSADATGANGHGGSVVVWSDGTTDFSGAITARGGATSGDGGTVETSGLEGLGASGTVDAAARGTGRQGTWLLDPKNITISAAATDPVTQFQAFLAPVNSSSSSGFGYVALDVEGTTYAIGDQYYGPINPGTSLNQGRVFIYENGALAATITNSSSSAGSGLFGRDVALNADRLATVSSTHAYLYVKGAGWQNGAGNLASSYQVDNGYSTSGGYFSVALDGNTLVAGVPFSYFGAAGAMDVFTINGTSIGTPTRMRASIWQGGVVYDAFGYRVAVSGNTIAATIFSSWNFFNDALTTSSSQIVVFERASSTSAWSGASQTLLNLTGQLQGTENGFGFGRSLAISGNTIVAGYEAGSGDISTGRGVYVFEKNGTWAASRTPVARLTGDGLGFGYSVDTDGSRIVVSAPNSANRGSSGLTYDPLYVFDRGSGWANGQANLSATLKIGTAAVSSTALGYAVAADGNRIIAGNLAGKATGQSNVAVYDFVGPFDLATRGTFSSNPGGSFNISATSLASTLSRGTNVTLQANNDITVSSAINVNNASGDGGDLTLQAGRRVLVNASITTDNGDLTLLAGDSRANATYRDSGEKVVVLGRDGSNAGVTLNLGTGNLLINAADRFENRTGSTNPFTFATTNPGRFLIFSTTPDQTGAPDAGNLLADLATVGRSWVYYNQTFDVATPTPSWLPTGSGFIYSVQPTVQVGVGNASITYGQSATASLSLTGLTLGGNPISGTTFGISSSDLPNLVTTGLAPSVTLSTGGFANAGTYTGGLTATAKSSVNSGSVYGVAVSTGAAGNLTVAKATLDVRPDNATRVYGDANPAFTATYTGFVTGDTAADLDTKPTISTPAVTNSNLGTYTLTATGGLDNNYLFNFTGTGLLTITARDLLLSGLTGVNRTYNGTTAASVTGTATINPVPGDSVSLAGLLTATATFADRNAGNNIAITLSGISLTGTAAGNYHLILPTNLTANITPATLTLDGLTAQNRTYDGTTDAAVTGTAAITPLGSDVVTLTGTPTAAFDDKTVGLNKPVTVTGVTLTGADANNYVLTAPSLTAAVIPLSVTVAGLTAQNRTYNGNTTATLTGTPTITAIPGDDVSVAGTATATFADKNAGTAKTVTVTGLSLVGLDAPNYALLYPSLTANITAAPLAITGLTGVNRTYDGTTVATISGTPTVTPFGADLVTILGTPIAAFIDKNAGTFKSISVLGYTLGGADARNYSIVQPTGLTATILPRPITLAGLIVNNKVYDGTTAATAVGTPTFGGILAGDTASFVVPVGGPTLTFADKNAGTGKTIAVSGITLTGADAANYDPTQISGLAADITPAALSIAGAAATSRAYNATTSVAVTGGTLAGVIGSDAVTLSTVGATGTLANKNVGTAKPVTASGYTISGTDAANYTLAQPTGLSADITAITLQILGLNGDKTYDGTAAATLTSSGFDAVVTGDTVTLNTAGVTATYADKNAAANKPITLAGLFALSGADAANYLLTQPGALTGTIARRGITVSGLTIADKIYDGTTTGTISGTGTFGGTISGDDLSINVGAVNVTFADKNVGTNKAVALSGVTLAGADAGNYTAATPTGITAAILAKDLTVTGLAALDKIYDRTTTATLTGNGALGGTIGGDSIGLDQTTRAGAFADKNAGTAKSVAVTGLALTGADAMNYRLVAPTLTASIARAEARVLGLTATNRVYNATTIAPLSGTATLDFGSLNNVLAASENVALSGTAAGAFANKNVGTAKAVTVSGLSLSGTDAANYNLLLPTALTANVTPASLTIAGATVANKTYDATTTATFTTLGTIAPLGADAVTLITSGAAASFAEKNIGTAKAVTASGYTISGADAANYTLAQPTGLTADITRANLLLTGVVADNRVYDGTRSAPLSGSLVVTPLRSDIVSVTGAPVATFADKNVGTAKPVTLTGLSLAGTDAANYNLVLPSLAASVTARPVTVTGLAAISRIYDGTTNATLSGTGSLTNTVAGDSVGFNLSALTASFANKNVGVDKLVTLIGNALTGADAANYTQILPSNLTATIAARLLSILGVDAVNRDYDRTTTVALTGGTLSGAVSGDTVSLVTAAATGTMADKNVGTNKAVTVTGYSLTGADAANYTYAQPTGVDVTIAPRSVTVTGLQVADKFFDGTTTATLSGGTLGGTLTGDDVSLVTTGGAANFTDPNVGLNKPVALTGFTLGGADAANYRLPTPFATTGNIIQSLSAITDVVPADVLRAAANAELDKQRQSLAAYNAGQQDLVTLVDYSAKSHEVAAGIVVPTIVSALISTPPAERDAATNAYVSAAEAAQAATANAQAIADQYRDAANAYKETGQTLNSVERQLQTEIALRDTFLARIAAADAEVAKARDNLAIMDEARRRVETLTAQMEQAARLGRGSEAAAYEKAIAEARAVLAGEATARAQFDQLTSAASDARRQLAASESKVADLTARKSELGTQLATAENRVNDLARQSTSAKAAAAAAVDKLEQTRTEVARARADELSQAEARLADLRKNGPANVNDIIARAMTASPEELKQQYPLSPERAAAANDAIAKSAAKIIEARNAEITQRKTELEAVITSASNEVGSLVRSPAARQVSGQGSAELANLDPKTLKIPDQQILSYREPVIQDLNRSAGELNKAMNEFGSVISFVDGLPVAVKLSLPDVDTAGSRGLQHLDKPVEFDATTEKALKNELQSFGVLKKFTTPGLSDLPVATQLKLQDTMQKVAAKQKELQAKGFDADAAAKAAFDDKTNEFITMLIFEHVEAYGIDEIPGVQEFVGAAIGELSAQFGVSPSGIAETLMNGDLKKIAGTPEQAAKAVGNVAVKIVTNPKQAGIDVAEGTYEVLKAGADAFLGVWTGNAAEKKAAEAEQAKVAFEARRAQLTRLGASITALETDRLDAVAQRDANLEQMKNVLVAQAKVREADQERTKIPAAAYAEASVDNPAVAALQRQEVSEQIARQYVADQKVRETQLAAAQAEKDKLAAQLAAINGGKGGP